MDMLLSKQKKRNVVLALILVVLTGIMLQGLLCSGYGLMHLVYGAQDAQTAAATDRARDALTQYQTFLSNPALYPDITVASQLLGIVLKFVSFVLGICGVLFVVVLAIRIVFDILIVALGWEPDSDGDTGTTSGIKGMIFGLSSFAKLNSGTRSNPYRTGTNKRDRSTLQASKTAHVPDSVGEYIKEFWVNILISLVAGGILITGQTFPLVSKLLSLSSVGIDTIMNMNFENTKVENIQQGKALQYNTVVENGSSSTQ